MICNLYIYVSCNEAVISSDYTASDSKMLNEPYIGRNIEGSGRILIRSNTPKFAGGTEKNHERPHSGSSLIVQTFKPGTSAIKI